MLEYNVAFSTVNHWEVDKALPNYTTMRKLGEYCSKHGISFDTE